MLTSCNSLYYCELQHRIFKKIVITDEHTIIPVTGRTCKEGNVMP